MTLDQLALTACQKRNAIGLEQEGTLVLGAWWWWRWAGWLEQTEVDEPCTAVELGVDGLDVPFAIDVCGLQYVDTSDLLWGLSGAPADDDGVAGVPEVEDLEWDRRLRGLASLEFLTAGECWGAELLSS